MSTRQRVLIVVLLVLFPLLWVVTDYLVDQLNALNKAQPAAPKSYWFKGNTHAHSLWSDGNDFPESIVHYYKENGYQFLVLTDHNILSRGEKWMPVAEVEERRKTLGHPTLKKYQMLFGDDWVETRTGEGGEEEVRLKTLEEFRGKFEEAGKFLLIEGEEVTDNFEEAGKNHAIHTNAVNIGEVIEPRGGGSVQEVIANNLRAIREQEQRLKRPILAHVDHPNFGWSLTPEDLANVIDQKFFEIYNGHPEINHLGRPASGEQEAVPGDERIWDIANTIRLRDLKAHPLFGVATDDSHTYHGGDISPGRGWVFVHAQKLEANELIKEMRAGNFYASTGVTLALVHHDSESLRIDIDPQHTHEQGVTYETEFFGTRVDSDPSEVGQVLSRSEGNFVLYQFAGDELFVRARVTSSLDHPNPSYEGQKQQAWTQPVGWEKHLPQPQAESSGD